MEARPSVVFAGAPVRPVPRLRARLAALRDPLVVAADAGASGALAFGLTPAILVGDLDSVDAAALQQLRDAHVTIEVHPRDKDATDGDLAVQRALDAGAQEILLLGYVGGDRLDQTLVNLLLLTRLPPGIEILDERNACWLLRAGEARSWCAEPNEIVSLVSVGGVTTSTTTRGLRWELTNEALLLGSTRGLSNEPVADVVTVEIQEGLLLVLRHFPSAGAQGPS